MKRRVKQNKTNTNYDIIDENGNILEDPEAAMAHVAEYFETLYQARKARPGYEEWTKQIIEENGKIKQWMETQPKADLIKKEEIIRAIQTLKREKATGPDELPNEIFIEADEPTVEIYQHIFNKILTGKEIPEEWLCGKIKRLYKGKGKKGKCSNERGITLSSNVGKVFERIINERAKSKVIMSDAQGGGKKGSATVDHILL